MSVIKATVLVSVQEDSYETVADYIGYIKDACEIACMEYGTVTINVGVAERSEIKAEIDKAEIDKSTVLTPKTVTVGPVKIDGITPETTIADLRKYVGRSH